jgi:lipoprotein-anchoring transpeptidase ErfK/SrfK
VRRAALPAGAGLLLATLAGLPAGLAAQAPGLPAPPLALSHGGVPAGAAPYAGPGVDTEGRYVVVSLSEHRLTVVQDGRALWSTEVGTGTGTRLAGAGTTWDFSTPRGMFRVQMKEKDPVWILPDWYFVERGEPVPPEDSPKRRMPGALGSSALFLGEEIAIHGTDRPELLGDDVSHGCIRVTNEAARQLFHETEVGTPVLIY